MILRWQLLRGIWLVGLCLPAFAQVGLPPGGASGSRGDPVTAELNYHESDPGTNQLGPVSPAPTPPPGGNIVAEIERIAAQMVAPNGSQANGTQEKPGHGAASLKVPLVPVLSHDGGTWKVTVEIKGSPEWAIDPGLSRESALGCTADHDQVLSRLASWSTIMTPAQVRQMNQDGVVEVPLTEPFADLQYLSSNAVNLRVKAALIHVKPLTVVDGRIQQFADPLRQLNAQLNLLQTQKAADASALQTLVDSANAQQAAIEKLQAALKPTFSQVDAIYAAAAAHPRLMPDGNKSFMPTYEQTQAVRALLSKVSPELNRIGRLNQQAKEAEKPLANAKNVLADDGKKLNDLLIKQALLQQAQREILRHPLVEQVDVAADGTAVFQQVYQPAAATNVREFDELVHALQDAEAARDAAKKLHDAVRGEYFAQQKKAQKRLQELAAIILPTAVKQAGVELAFNTVDILEAYGKRGLGGAMVEFAGKIAEFEAKSLTDSYGTEGYATTNLGSVEEQMNKELNADLTDPTAAQQVAKSAITDGINDLTIGRLKDYANMIAKAEPGWTTSIRTTKLGRVFNRVKAMENTREYGAVDAVETAYKEVVKTALQKSIADDETAAWKSYFTEELKARLLFPIYQDSNGNYQTALDAFDRAQAAKDDYLKNNPPPSPTDIWKVTMDSGFADESALLISLGRGQPPNGQKFAVKIQDRSATAESASTFSFKLPSATIVVPVTISTVQAQ